ncbi:MAG: hypothetical protein P4L74_06815 [Candidatus Doudnabacteria bacterium]|nr:hypothetical protein [Candidatus Doudnabacteria bacterium]
MLKQKQFVMLSIAIIFVLVVCEIKLKYDNKKLIETNEGYVTQTREILATWQFMADFKGTWRHSDEMGVSDMVDYLNIIGHKKCQFRDSNLNAIWNRGKEMMIDKIIDELQKKQGIIWVPPPRHGLRNTAMIP